MKVKIWGCRGSMVSPGAGTLRYGGHTTCVEIQGRNGQVVVVDAGSGLRNFGRRLLRENGPKEVQVLMTHAHWDHLNGFPFFEPAYRPDFKLVFCGGPRPLEFLKQILTHQMMAPFFPVDFHWLKSRIEFSCDCASANCEQGFNHNQNGLRCASIPLNHPNGGYGFKLTEDGRSLVFIPDNEIRFHHESGPDRAAFVNFCRGVELLIHDANYTEEQYARTRGWGHSTITDALDLALDAGVKRLGLFHHDPDHTDTDLDRLQDEARRYVKERSQVLDCFMCIEGMELEV